MSAREPLTVSMGDHTPSSNDRPIGRAEIDRKLAVAEQRLAELQQRVTDRKAELRAALAAEMAVARDELTRLDADRDRQLADIERQADGEIERMDDAVVVDAAHDGESMVEDPNDEF